MSAEQFSFAPCCVLKQSLQMSVSFCKISAIGAGDFEDYS